MPMQKPLLSFSPVVLSMAAILILGTACNRRSAVPAQGGGAKPVETDEPSVPEALRALSREARASLIHAADKPILDLYRDVTAESGVAFTYRNGQEAEHYAILESLGGGVALIDYDGDGLLDLFFPGGGYFDGPDRKTIRGYPNRLYKNLGNFRFRDVTAEVGLDNDLFYTHGAAVADFNRDGWPDLLVTGRGRLALYRNDTDGKGGRHFTDVTRQAGLTEELWSTSAAFADFDGDGFPDLYVCQYVDWSWRNHPACPGYSTKYPRDVCPPKSFKGLPHRVYRNTGRGTFADVSKDAKLRPHTGDPSKDGEVGKGLGVVVIDVDGDTRPDIYVANDTVDNFLYLNRSVPGKIVFEEVGLPAGVARDDRGVPSGSMGADGADYDGSGRASLWCTNYENELHGLYRNQGQGLFSFSTPASGIAAIGQLYVGFGTGFLDLDNDGREDLAIVNGHVIRFPGQLGVRQRPVLFRNHGLGMPGKPTFAAITGQGGTYFRSEHCGRGLAIGDLDNRGRPDLVVSHQNEPVSILRHEADTGNHWLGIELAGTDHRDLVGARVTVEVAGRRLTRFVKGGGSYLSSNDRRLLFGLARDESVTRVTVYWPLATEQSFGGEKFELDGYWRLTEGKAEPQRVPRKSARPQGSAK